MGSDVNLVSTSGQSGQNQAALLFTGLVKVNEPASRVSLLFSTCDPWDVFHQKNIQRPPTQQNVQLFSGVLV